MGLWVRRRGDWELTREVDMLFGRCDASLSLGRRKSWGRYGVVLGAALFGFVWQLASVPAAYALAFVPTEEEWALWPAYCRARYPETGYGSMSKWRNAVPSSEVQRWRKQIGREAWHYLHHYCAGLAYLQHARYQSPGPERDLKVNAAIPEIISFLERTPKSHPLFVQASTDLGWCYKLKGEMDVARQYLQGAMEAQPAHPSAYTLLSLMYREAGMPDEAIKALQKGNDATKGKSAEIQYNLGLMMLEGGDLEAARKHARAAYKLGYPLQKLKQKLTEQGAWTD